MIYLQQVISTSEIRIVVSLWSPGGLLFLQRFVIPGTPRISGDGAWVVIRPGDDERNSLYPSSVPQICASPGLIAFPGSILHQVMTTGEALILGLASGLVIPTVYNNPPIPASRPPNCAYIPIKYGTLGALGVDLWYYASQWLIPWGSPTGYGPAKPFGEDFESVMVYYKRVESQVGRNDFSAALPL